MLNTLKRIEEIIYSNKAGYLDQADADEIIYHCRNMRRNIEKPTKPAEEVFDHAGMNYTRSYGAIPAAVAMYETICKP